MLIAQLINKFKCPLTEFVNNRCNIKKTSYLRDLMHYADFKSAREYFLIVCLVSSISYCKLKEKKKNLFDLDFSYHFINYFKLKTDLS